MFPERDVNATKKSQGPDAVQLVFKMSHPGNNYTIGVIGDVNGIALGCIGHHSIAVNT